MSQPETDPPITPLPVQKPGWMSRVFGIETARLQASSACWNGYEWERGEEVRFLYRSRRGHYFLLGSARTWTVLRPAQALELFRQLPQHVVSEADAFAPVTIEPLQRGRDDAEDTRIYRVVRNDKWEFSLWLDHKEMPSGWSHVGVSGKKVPCLEYINKNCVFGAPNPGMP